MWKTFRDFVRLARRTYGLGSLGKAGQIVCEKLQKNRLNPIDVICYINWADGDCLSSDAIGKKLNIPGRTVRHKLAKIRFLWPHLFYFGPRIPQFGRKTSCRGTTMGRLRSNIPTTAQKF